MNTERWAKLSPRQKEVARLRSNGFHFCQIAAILNCRPKTVDAHVQAIYDRLDIHNLCDLTRFVVSIEMAEAQ